MMVYNSVQAEVEMTYKDYNPQRNLVTILNPLQQEVETRKTMVITPSFGTNYITRPYIQSET